MEATVSMHNLAFILQGGFVSISVAMILVVMSLWSWVLIVSKGIQYFRLRVATRNYIAKFWQNETLEQAMKSKDVQSPAYRLGLSVVDSAQHYQHFVASQTQQTCSMDTFIARQIGRALTKEQNAMEAGLSVLASVGSVAPFVGLFGTVWGIYHALSAISTSGAATIDKVAGPVGEALIMTAIGLAVAIPAVLGYNALLKANRKVMAQLESFGQDVHTLLITGAPLVIQPKLTTNVTRLHRVHKAASQGGVA